MFNTRKNVKYPPPPDRVNGTLRTLLTRTPIGNGDVTQLPVKSPFSARNPPYVSYFQETSITAGGDRDLFQYKFLFVLKGWFRGEPYFPSWVSELLLVQV